MLLLILKILSVSVPRIKNSPLKIPLWFKDDDDDTCEEWERYESLHDDVTKQNRTEERLFEEEMEIVWDKGSSGLVFYTDAAYWDAMKGGTDVCSTHVGAVLM